MELHDIRVSSYAGYKANERPLEFTFKGKRHKIKEIISQTYEDISGKGLKRRFTIKTDDGLTFKLFYDESQDQWFLEK